MKIRPDQADRFAEMQRRTRRAHLAGQIAAAHEHARVDPASGNVIVEDRPGRQSVIAVSEQGIAGIRTPGGRTFRFDRDVSGRVSRVTDPEGRIVELAYDSSGAIRDLRRNGRQMLACETSAGNGALDATFADGTRERIEYSAGQLARTVDGAGNETRFVRDAELRVIAVTDARGSTTRYDHDPDERTAVRIALPDGVTEAYEERDDGSLAVTVNGQPHATVSRRGDDGIEQAQFADGHAVAIAWDGDRPVRGINPHISVEFAYDAEGRVVKESQGKLEVEYAYDDVGNLAAVKTSDGESLRFRYDDDDLLVGVTDWTGAEIAFSHDGSGSVTGIRFPNGVVTTAAISPEGHYASITTHARAHGAAPIVDERYAYDERDRVVRREARGQVWHHAYDRAGRLARCESATTGIAEVSEAYEYDGAGNRIGSGSGSAEYDVRNRLLVAGSERFQHDLHGNLVAKPGASYRYNGQGHLVEANTARGGKVEFAYDAFGRRILKRSAGVTTQYRWLGRQLLSEWAERGGQVVERRDYVFLPGDDYPLAVRINGRAYYYHTDRLGTPLAMTDSMGRTVWAAEYAAFGEARAFVMEVRQPLRWIGQYHDEETSLHYNVFRYYDPQLGRYITEDPLRYGAGSTNFYTYAGNDPVNRRDPHGLIVPLVAIGIIAGAALIGGLIGGAIEAATAPEGERGAAFARGFGWGALAGGVGAAVPIIGAALGLGALAIGAIALGADAVIAGIEACSTEGASVGTFLKGAGISVAMTLGTLGLSKIPGVKRVLGKIGKKLSSAGDALRGKAKQAYYKLFPADLAVSRSERRLAEQARKKAAAAAAEKAAARKRVSELANEGHGPQRHEGDVTDQQLKDRAMHGKDPMTGTTVDGVTGGVHKTGKNATKINSPEDYVKGEDALRNSDEFKQKAADAMANGEDKIVVENMKLEDIYGPSYQDNVSGQTRQGTKNNPTGTTPTDFTDGTMTGVYKKDPGTGEWKLVTMYPEPK